MPGRPQAPYTTPGSVSDPDPNAGGIICDDTLGIQGYFDGYGIRVTAVMPGSPAERVGVEVGDDILAVDGNAVQCTDDYYIAMSQSNGYVRLRLLDCRSGEVVFRNVNVYA
jgi:S1-C subfamily serine protease